MGEADGDVRTSPERMRFIWITLVIFGMGTINSIGDRGDTTILAFLGFYGALTHKPFCLGYWCAFTLLSVVMDIARIAISVPTGDVDPDFTPEGVDIAMFTFIMWIFSALAKIYALIIGYPLLKMYHKAAVQDDVAE